MLRQCIAVADVFMAYVVMAYAVMAYVVTVYVVMADLDESNTCCDNV